MLFWFGLGMTVLISALPTFGILGGLLLPIIQVFVLERANTRFRTHFGPLHTTVVEFYSVIFFGLLAVFQGITGLILVSFSAPVNAVFFLAVWWAYEKYCRFHFRLTAESKMPHPIELTVIGLCVACFVGPPIVIMLAVLISYSR